MSNNCSFAVTEPTDLPPQNSLASRKGIFAYIFIHQYGTYRSATTEPTNLLPWNYIAQRFLHTFSFTEPTTEPYSMDIFTTMETLANWYARCHGSNQLIDRNGTVYHRNGDKPLH